MLPLQRNRVIPIRCMQQRPLVLVQPWNGRPPPVIQDAAGIDEDVAVVAEEGPRRGVLDLDVVAAAAVVPVGADDLVLRLDVLLEAVLVGEAVKVLEDLLGGRVDGRPVEFGLEAPGVVVGGDVTGASTGLC